MYTNSVTLYFNCNQSIIIVLSSPITFANLLLLWKSPNKIKQNIFCTNDTKIGCCTWLSIGKNFIVSNGNYCMLEWLANENRLNLMEQMINKHKKSISTLQTNTHKHAVGEPKWIKAPASMSPAHLHQYVASVSPGQLSESLPSSQVNICTCLPIHQNAINETQFNFNTHTKKTTNRKTHKHTHTHTPTQQKQKQNTQTTTDCSQQNTICTIPQSNSNVQFSNYVSLSLYWFCLILFLWCWFNIHFVYAVFSGHFQLIEFAFRQFRIGYSVCMFWLFYGLFNMWSTFFCCCLFVTLNWWIGALCPIVKSLPFHWTDWPNDMNTNICIYKEFYDDYHNVICNKIFRRKKEIISPIKHISHHTKSPLHTKQKCHTHKYT